QARCRDDRDLESAARPRAHRPSLAGDRGVEAVEGRDGPSGVGGVWVVRLGAGRSGADCAAVAAVERGTGKRGASMSWREDWTATREFVWTTLRPIWEFARDAVPPARYDRSYSGAGSLRGDVDDFT